MSIHLSDNYKEVSVRIKDDYRRYPHSKIVIKPYLENYSGMTPYNPSIMSLRFINRISTIIGEDIDPVRKRAREIEEQVSRRWRGVF